LGSLASCDPDAPSFCRLMATVHEVVNQYDAIFLYPDMKTIAPLADRLPQVLQAQVLVVLVAQARVVRLSAVIVSDNIGNLVCELG
jgi:hypothetical protein